MSYEIPGCYWNAGTKDGYVHLEFQYGGHQGGECEIFIPEEKMEKFCTDEEWELKTVALFSRIIFLGSLESSFPIPKEKQGRDGKVPLDWE